VNIAPALDNQIVAASADAAILNRITADDTQLAIWHRPLPVTLAWVDTLEWNRIDDLDFPAPVDALDAEIAEGLEEAGYPRDERGVALRDEIATLARRFAAIIDCETVKLRLEVVQTDACRKFHADAVTARLLTTLSGPGTQWIETEVPDRISQLAAGDVAVFKGRLWAEEPVILHRSPPIAGTPDTRLLLVIDPFDPVKEAAHD